MAELKRQAKVRGLSPKGHKATLIQKIHEHDRSKPHEPVVFRDSPVPVPARDLSTTSTRPGVAPGLPSATQSMNNPSQHFVVNIPDIPQADPDSSVQVPYVPDFWDSSVSVDDLQMEETLPKLLVVAGADTHPGGGPSHNLLDANLDNETVSSDVKSNTTAPNPTGQGNIWDDVTEDLGLPYLKEMKTGFWKLFS